MDREQGSTNTESETQEDPGPVTSTGGDVGEQLHNDTSPGNRVDDREDEEDRFIVATRKVTSSIEKAVGASYRTVKTAAESVRSSQRPAAGSFDRLLNWMHEVLPPSRLESAWDSCQGCGRACVVVAAVLSVLFGLMGSSWTYTVGGLVVALLLMYLNYTAGRLVAAGESLIESSPSCISAGDFLTCVAFVAEAGGIALLFLCLVAVRRSGEWIYVLSGASVLSMCYGIALIALNPSMVNVSTRECVSAGEEGIGIMSFLAKAVARSVPLVFGIGTLTGTIGLLFGTLSLAGGGSPVLGLQALWLTIVCAGLPFAGYVFLATALLAIDVLESIVASRKEQDETQVKQ